MFIVVETFWPENSSVVVNEDGEVKLFNTRAEAEAEASECQRGQILQV